jgi:hypothetical protein
MLKYRSYKTIENNILLEQYQYVRQAPARASTEQDRTKNVRIKISLCK